MTERPWTPWHFNGEQGEPVTGDGRCVAMWATDCGDEMTIANSRLIAERFKPDEFRLLPEDKQSSMNPPIVVSLWWD